MFLGIREVQERISERIVKVPGRYVDGTLKTSRVAERGRQSEIGNSVVVCVCTYVLLCVRACMCVCGCVCVCVRRFVHVYTICGTAMYRPKERPELSVAFEFDPWTSFYNYMTTLGEKKLVRIEFAKFFLPVEHLLRPFFCGYPRGTGKGL